MTAVASTAASISESDLINRLRADDERAYETLVRTHGPRMLAVAKRMLACEQDASDALQDAFISAFRSIDSFSQDSQLRTWLHRIVVNACLMKIRSDSRRKTVSIENCLPAFDDTGHHTQHPRSCAADAHERVALSETRAHVRACIDQLPDSYRTVLLLRDIEELDTDETANLLGCSKANVKTRLHRARQALRTLLEPAFTE